MTIFSKIRNAGAAIFLLLSMTGALAADPLQVVTTTTDLAYFASQVGGNRVRAEALIHGYDDPHFIDARPDYILKVNRADVYAMVGLDLEVGWSPVLLRQSRNSKVRQGGPGYCDASLGVHILEQPVGAISRALGDIHAYGNPHYQTDPLNAAIAARNIRDALVRVDPDGQEEYEKNYAALNDRLKKMTMDEMKKFQKYKGLKVAVYHREFIYLAHRFGFNVDLSLEEKPGVPPSASYLEKVVREMKKDKIKIILRAPWDNPRYAKWVADRTGAKVIIMPLSVGSEPGIDTYEKAVETMLERIRSAADETGAVH